MNFRMLTYNTCLWCDKAKDLIQQKGGAFESHSIQREPWLKDLTIKAGFKTVPQIWTAEGEYIGGYENLVAWFAEKDQQQQDD